MKPGQSTEYDSEMGSEYGGSRYFGGDSSAQFDNFNNYSGVRTFQKPVLGTQQFNLPSNRSGEYAPLTPQPYNLPSIQSGEFAPHQPYNNLPSIRSGEHALQSGEFDADTLGELPGQNRANFRDYNDQSYDDNPGQFIPSSGNLGPPSNRSGFGGRPPPPPSSYRPAIVSGEYVPIGKTVQFSATVDTRD